MLKEVGGGGGEGKPKSQTPRGGMATVGCRDIYVVALRFIFHVSSAAQSRHGHHRLTQEGCS